MSFDAQTGPVHLISFFCFLSFVFLVCVAYGSGGSMGVYSLYSGSLFLVF